MLYFVITVICKNKCFQRYTFSQVTDLYEIKDWSPWIFFHRDKLWQSSREKLYASNCRHGTARTPVISHWIIYALLPKLVVNLKISISEQSETWLSNRVTPKLSSSFMPTLSSIMTHLVTGCHSKFPSHIKLLPQLCEHGMTVMQ